MPSTRDEHESKAHICAPTHEHARTLARIRMLCVVDVQTCRILIESH